MHGPRHCAPGSAPSAGICGVLAPCGRPKLSAEGPWTAPADLALPVQVPRNLSPKLHWVLYAPPVHGLILLPVEEACACLVLSVLDLHKGSRLTEPRAAAADCACLHGLTACSQARLTCWESVLLRVTPEEGWPGVPAPAEQCLNHHA